MRDYLNSFEKNQFMVLISILQLIEGKRNNSGMDGLKLGTMIEEWSKRDNLTKDEKKNLKTGTTFLRKYINSIYDRLSLKEQQIIDKKVLKFDFKLIDDYTLKQVHRDITDSLKNAVVPRQEFYDWCSEIMEIKCNGCTKDWKTCNLHQAFDNNFVPESGFDCTNCKYAYRLEDTEQRQKGDRYRPVVNVKKAVDGVPTSIELGGYKYALVPDDYINGNKNKVQS